MYTTLISKIKTTLEAVTNVKEVFSIPKTKITKYPAVFFKPIGFTNDFETNKENSKTYRFTMMVIVGAQQTTLDNVFNTVLPNTVDAILAKFDEDWDGGTIDGHRCRIKIDSADAWEISGEQDGLEAYAPLNVEIRVLTTN